MLRTNPRFVLVALIAVFSTTNATLACTCIEATLEEHYADNASVFTARITWVRRVGAVLHADFDVTEKFKGDVAFKRIVTSFGSCGGSTLTVAFEYLFFGTDDGLIPATCLGHAPLDNPRNPKAHWVKQLRDYRNGTVGDLSAAWSFFEHDGLCGLTEIFLLDGDVGRSSISFFHRIKEPKWSSTSFSDIAIGESELQLLVPGDRFGKDWTVTLEANDNRYYTIWDPKKYFGRGRFILMGSEVLDLARLLEQLPFIEAKGDIPEDGAFDAQIRTTNLGDAAEQFFACVENSATDQ